MCNFSINSRNNSFANTSVSNTPNQSKVKDVQETKQTPKTEQTETQTKDKVEIQTKNINSSKQENVPAPVNQSLSNAFSKGIADKAKKEEISPKRATEFSQAETDKVIKAAEKYGNDLFPKDPVAAADVAWSWSLQKRSADPKDVNWAAAEHYLYAKSRSKESKVEGVTMGVLAAGYDVVKAGLFAVGKEEWLSTTGKADDISKPTLGSTLSGIKGAIDGF